jgi:hypothetical protein
LFAFLRDLGVKLGPVSIPVVRITVWPIVEEYPPIKVRLLAKHPGQGVRSDGSLAITDAELAIASGIPLDRVREISKMFDWNRVMVGEMRSFCAACRFDPTSATDRERIRIYEHVCLKRNKRPFQWLRDSPRYEAEFLPLIRLLSGRSTTSPAQHVA